MGIFGWRSPEDESLVQALAVSCSFDPDPCQAAGEINGNNVIVTDSGEHPSISDLSGAASKPKKVLETRVEPQSPGIPRKPVPRRC